MSGNLGGQLINALTDTSATSPATWGQQMQNMNALQDYQAKQATADAYRQSIDANGNFDQAGFNARIARGAGAWNAGPTMQQSGQAQIAQGDANASQVSGHLAQLKLLNGEMSDLLQSGQPVTRDQITARLNSIGKEGWLPPQFMNNVTTDLNSQPPDADLTPWLRNHFATNLSATDALKNVTSQPQIQRMGDRDIVVEGNTQMQGGQRVGTSYVQGQPPTTQGATTRIHYPDGSERDVPTPQVNSVLGANGGSYVVPPGGGGGSVSGSEAPVNAAGDSATRKAAEGGPPAPGTPGAAVAQRTHDFWISQGYNEAQVAGILAGGPGSESDFNPSVSGDKGTSYGLYQHHADRLAAMQKYFGLTGNQMPSEAQQNQYAAYEISPQGPPGLNTIGAQLKQATTPAQAAAIWTRSFGVPGDKTEIGRRANGAQRYAGIYAQPDQGPQGPQGPQRGQQAPPAQPQGPPGVQMGGAPPPPPGGSQAPYTGGGIGNALAPGGAANPVVIRGTPIPAGRVVGAIQQGMQTATATPMPANALMAGPGAPSSAAPAAAAAPWPATTTTVGNYNNTPAAPPAPPAPAAPVVQPPAQAVPPQAQRGAGWSAPPGYAEAQKITAEAGAKRGNDLVNQLTASSTVKPILAEMEDVLTKSGGTGFGTAHISAFRQALERLGLTPAAVDVATPQAALETFKKLSAQLQGAQLGTVGGVPTDDRQSLIEASNPSTLNSTAGNKSIIHVLQGTQQALETMGRAWMSSPEYQKDPGKFDNWRTKFTAKDPTTGGQFDPRTFWLNNMPPDEQHAYLSNMTPKGLAEFKKNWAYARGQGWVEPLPGQPATAPGG